MRAVEIEIKLSAQAMVSLYESMAKDVKLGTIGDGALGQVDSCLRALRAALDKLVNGLYLETHGERSGNLYYPLADEDALSRRMEEGTDLAWLNGLPSDAVAAIRHSLRAEGPLQHVRELYRDAAHHDNLRSVETQHEVALVAPVMALIDNQIRLGNAPVWFGFAKSATEQSGGPYTAIGGTFADFVFGPEDTSVLGYLAQLHNEVITLYQAIGAAKGWDTSAVDEFVVGLPSY